MNVNAILGRIIGIVQTMPDTAISKAEAAAARAETAAQTADETLSGSIRFDEEQDLTPEQQEQVRQNIGVINIRDGDILDGGHAT